jgi:predicted membrane GTPase involved in stress response
VPHDGSIQKVKITELLMTEALERPHAGGQSAGPGDIIAVAGIPEITIGETLADADNPIPLPLITVDEPAISMTIGTNTSPDGRSGPRGQGHRAPGQGPARPRAGRQRLAARPAHRASRRLGGPGSR